MTSFGETTTLRALKVRQKDSRNPGLTLVCITTGNDAEMR